MDRFMDKHEPGMNNREAKAGLSVHGVVGTYKSVCWHASTCKFSLQLSLYVGIILAIWTRYIFQLYRGTTSAVAH